MWNREPQVLNNKFLFVFAFPKRKSNECQKHTKRRKEVPNGGKRYSQTNWNCSQWHLMLLPCAKYLVFHGLKSPFFVTIYFSSISISFRFAITIHIYFQYANSRHSISSGFFFEPKKKKIGNALRPVGEYISIKITNFCP